MTEFEIIMGVFFVVTTFYVIWDGYNRKKNKHTH